MKPSEVAVKLKSVGLLFEELLMLEMIRDMEDRNVSADFEVAGVRVMDAVIMAGGGTGLNEEKKNGVYVGGLCFASPATAFKYITNLNQKNFVRKEIDGGDRRANVLTVTGLGRKLLEEVGARDVDV